MAQATLLITKPAGASCLAEQPLETSAVVCHLSHELRQPLSTIETSAYYLKMILPGVEPRAAQQLDKIQQMVDQVNWILSDAIYYLQPAPARPEWLDLTELITDHLTAETMHHAVELDWTVSSATPLVRMDLRQANHMIRAILSVFRQIGRTDHPVFLSFCREDENAVLGCSCAASPELCEIGEGLLQPFTPHLPAGSGLALASVRRIAEVHAGKAEIRGGNGVLRLEVTLPTC